MSSELMLGWALGVISSLLTALVMFGLEGRREIRKEQREQRRENIRIAHSWQSNEERPSLRGFDLRGANLSGKNLSGADLEDANLEGVQMWGTDFSGANLRRANFRKATLIGVSFKRADLHSADFDKAILRESDFSEARLRRTRLRHVRRIEGCVWQSVLVDETTELSPQALQEIGNQQLQSETGAADDRGSGARLDR